jgi:hypothetical protein
MRMDVRACASPGKRVVELQTTPPCGPKFSPHAATLSSAQLMKGSASRSGLGETD